MVSKEKARELHFITLFVGSFLFVCFFLFDLFSHHTTVF